MKKIQIDFIDGIPLTKKIKINGTDKNGEQLFIGQTIVDKYGEKYVIGYRYGNVCLVPPFGMHTVGVTSYERYTLTNEMTCVMGKYLIIGYDNEDFFKENSEVLDSINITNLIDC